MSILRFVRKFTEKMPPWLHSRKGEFTQPGVRQPPWFALSQLGLLGFLAFLAERAVLEPVTAVVALAATIVYASYLLAEEFSILVGYVDASVRDPVDLVASHVRGFGDALTHSRAAVAAAAAAATDSQAVRQCARDRYRRLMADFCDGQPHLSIIVTLLRKLTFNLLLMVVCLSIITMCVVKLELWQGVPSSGYHALCVKNQGQFFKLLPRLIYSHTIELQGGYESSQAPTTHVSIIVSFVQAGINLLYVSLTLGGALTAAAYILARLSDEKIRLEIRGKLEDLIPP